MFCWCNLNLDTRLNMNVWNKHQVRTKKFLTFIQSFCFSVKIVLGGNIRTSISYIQVLFPKVGQHYVFGLMFREISILLIH